MSRNNYNSWKCEIIQLYAPAKIIGTPNRACDNNTQALLTERHVIYWKAPAWMQRSAALVMYRGEKKQYVGHILH